MKGTILYFSGTGNTKLIANKVFDEFEKNKCSMQIYSIEEKDEIKSDSYDYLILGFPKHFEYIPIFFLEYIKEKVPQSKKEVKTLLFCTTGEERKTYFDDLEKILLEKNHKVIYTKSFFMANNYLVNRLYKVTKSDEIEIRQAKAIGEVKEMVENFLIDKEIKEELGLFKKFKGVIFRRIATNLSENFCKNSYRLSVNENCNKCNLCIETCPSNNIEKISDQIKFRDNCIMCTRCINICPLNSIIYNEKMIPQYTENIHEIFINEELIAK